MENARESQSQHRANMAEIQFRVLRDAPMGMFVKDVADGNRYVDVNNYLCDVFAIKAEDILGKSDADLWPPDVARSYQKHDREALLRGISVSADDTFFDSVGRVHRIRTIRTPTRTRDGHAYLVGYWMDISETFEHELQIESLQRRTQCERDRAVLAEQSEAFVAHLLKGVVSQPLGTDPMDFLLEHIGKRLGVDRCYVYTCKLVDGSWKADHVYEWCNTGIATEKDNLIAHGPPGLPDFCDAIDAGRDFFFRDAASLNPVTRAWFERRGVKSFYATPLKDEKGVSVGYLGFDYVRAPHGDFSDAGRDNAHETASVVNVCYMRQRAIDAARKAERAKSDFFASISHDIRTPLNSIIGFSSLLRGETDPDRRAEYLDDILFSGNALLELINDVLDLSQMDAGKQKPNRTFYDGRRQLERVLRAQEVMAREKGLVLTSTFDADFPWIALDEHRARQVLFNLVGNAVKYTDRGRIDVRASFERRGADTGTLRLAVADTGIGIASEDVARLMQPYVRIQASNARGGTGLGLAICKRIVEQAGGSISISSTLGEGSTFVVVVPNVGYRDSDACGSQPEAADAQARKAVVSDLSSRRVLIVDDLEMNCKVLSASCRQLGVRDVTVVTSGAAALERLREGPAFDVVLTDMKMPGMSGEDLIRAIRREPKFAGLPIYLVTADVEARKYAPGIGATGVLLKPIVRPRLMEALVTLRRENS